MIALGAKMAGADGEVSDVEVEAFRNFFQVPPGEEKNVERFFDLAKRDVAGFETYARQLAALFPDAPEVLENVLEGLFDIAQADGPVDAAEADYLAKVARIFGLEQRALRARQGGGAGRRRVRALHHPRHRSAGDRRADPRGLAAPGARQSSRPADRPGPARGGDHGGQPQARADQRRLRPAAPRARARARRVVNVVDLPSPNHAPRPADAASTCWCCTTPSCRSKESLDILRDGAREHRVSAHYVLAEDGTVYRLVPEDRVAWHAGRSHWRGREALNATSIGVEIVNLHGDRHDYPDGADRGADRALPRHHRAPSRHRAAQRRRPFRHRAQAQDRSRPALSLGDAGRGRHRPVAAPRRRAARRATSRRRSQRFGYPPAVGVTTADIVASFQRRFRPARVDGIADPETRALLADLLDQVGARSYTNLWT